MNAKGFTLIEVLIAMLILTVAILGFYNLYGVSIRTRMLNYNMSKALNIVHQRVDELKTTPYNNLSDGQSIVENYYRLEWKVKNQHDLPDTKKIVVSIGWEGKNCLNSIDQCNHTIKVVNFVTK